MSSPQRSTETETARTDLRDAWSELVRARPGLRQRDAAELLGVSEGELLASRVGEGVVPLRRDWPLLLAALAPLGPVKTITRNATAVHETVGVYENVTFVGSIGLVQSEGLDLRLMLERWTAGFLVSDRHGDGRRHSLQFFDASGAAMHKIFAERELDLASLAGLLSRFTDREATTPRLAREGNGAAPSRRSPAGAVERASLLADWSALIDTHDFGTMLARHGVDRRSAMEAAEGEFSTPIPPSALGTTLEALRDAAVDTMVFVGNAGAVQIRSGKLGNVKRLGPWMNILDETFNLHVLEAGVEAMWVVRKPTADGVVTSIEAYAADGSEVAILYGHRKPGIAESDHWRSAVAEVAKRSLS